MADYYNGFDVNARAEKNKPGVERALEILEKKLKGMEDVPPSVLQYDYASIHHAKQLLDEELWRINYLIAEMGDA